LIALASGFYNTHCIFGLLPAVDHALEGDSRAPAEHGGGVRRRTVRPSSTKASAVVFRTSAVTLQWKWFQLFQPLRRREGGHAV
jgi:hypothetical protein